ncbi:hypothetical protein [Daejeonella sp.]|uniref:hypothetical protein n=1 Tax=Daejeonella sp. TaxID=2805397 RepID=UPI002730B745|nr:hypothetical protein [Daejeonella sp.]MDP2412310.1 hypothetical protein [Daejeonella sp.]
MKKRALYFLIPLLAFLGLGAIGGGGVLILSPSGQLMGMPLSLLDHLPFTNFLIPGIILFSVLGLAPFLLIFALSKKPKSSFAEMLNCFDDMHWSWTFSVYMAFILIIWIQVQMVFIQAVSWLHAFYIFLALLILFVCLLPGLRQEFKKAD